MAISITKPTVGGSEDTWGTTINTALDTIVDAVNGTAGTTAPNLTEGSWQIGGTPVTATAAELNILDDVTSTTEELNLLDGATANTVVNNKAAVYGASGQLAVTTLGVTTVDLGDWTVTESAGVLYFATGGVNKMKIDASGNLTVVGNVTAYGTV